MNIDGSEDKKKELDFDNCNVYLKGDGENTNNPNRLSSRKRSAYKFIENTIDKNSSSININSNVNLSNSVKSTKDPLNDKISKELNTQFNNFNLRGKEIPNGFVTKNSITSTNAINNTPITEKKTEYQSRRKNQNITNNILGELDNPRVIDIKINSSISNKSEIDKNDHNNFGFRKVSGTNQGSNNNLKELGNFSNRDMMVSDSNYKKTPTNPPVESNLGLFNSRRHVTNTSTINTFNNPVQPNSPLPNNLNSKPGVKDKNNKFLII